MGMGEGSVDWGKASYPQMAQMAQIQEGRDPRIGGKASHPQMAQMAQIQEGGIRGLGKGELSADGADDADC